MAQLPLDADIIERALRELWRLSRQEDGPESRNLKLSLATLVVVATPANRDEAETIIRFFSAHRPSRVIMIIVADEFAGQPHAHVSASCNLITGSRDRLCWEMITIEAGEEALADVVALVRSLQIGGTIPVILVDLYGLRRRVDMRPKYYGAADYVFRYGRDDFRLLLPPPGAFSDQPIYGFEWVTIDPLREAIRAFFDDPRHLKRLETLKVVVITSGPESDLTTSLLLAGWIISSLELDLESVSERVVGLVGSGGRIATLEFHGEDDTPPGRITVQMRFDQNGLPLEFRLDDGRVTISFEGVEEAFIPPRPFDRPAFVAEQSGKDRQYSSYGASYRIAAALYSRRLGTAGRRAMIVVPEAARLAQVTARLFYRLAMQELEAKQSFYVALAGGATPKAVYRAIVESSYAGAIDWGNVFFFFSDERAVGPDDLMSNFKTADEFLFRPLGINPDNVFRLKGEIRPPRDACRQYEVQINDRVPRDADGLPRFDLIFLGMGDDGHTASLFPEIDIDKVCGDRLVAHIYIPRLDQQRLSFTPKLINNAAHVFFVVSGDTKAAALAEVFAAAPLKVLPAARIDPRGGNVLWLVDQAAAGRLNGMTLPVEVTRW